ncbi:hypothetical protein SAMN04487996_102244 [Dyadobacter soli]|uniref:TonB C-terminal domain-containing protein n=1 Tax=Dyadobacter soli TaxID=659014 RepID=A0A1G6XTU3_9BACT|nr:hypothetical protein [Dyadobacter soli]SDD81133.1 hypothetical protein SAMN04487996_102244 [Dyadobacter soli]
MAATSDHIPDFDDFERYYSGEMPPAEQRSLEGRMLAEPLVAEAYEGFLAWRAQHTGAAAVRADLQERLHTRVAHTRRRALPLWSYASAASVLLAVFSYWFVFLRDQEADMQKPEVAVKRDKAALPAAEQAPATIQGKAPETSATVPAAPDASKPDAHALANRLEQTSKPLPKPGTALVPSQLADAEIQEEVADIASADSFKGETEVIQVPPEAANALPSPGSAQSVAKSMAGRVRMEPSSLYNVSEDRIGAGTQVAREQIAVAKPEAAHKKTTKHYTILPDIPAPVPAEGWASYQTYLDKNTASAPAEGKVIVKFVVGTLGTLSGFVASGPEELQKEAIRIISNGPAWVSARREGLSVASMAEITLQFRQDK